MYRILEKKRLNSQNVYMKLDAPHIAGNANAGQFVVLRIDERGERIPLTIYDHSSGEGWICIIFQEIGVTTKKLGRLDEGDSLVTVLGPLGHCADLNIDGDVLCIGGGVGIAEIFPVAKGFKGAGNGVTTVIGARTKDLLILEKELRGVSDEVCVSTDDGSSGRKGLVTEVIEELLEKKKYTLVYAVGPIPMMRAVAALTKKYDLKTVVSLNANMLDATGMCGTCRVTVGGKIKFACVDGPDFDAHQVDFDEMINRDRRFKAEEETALRCHEKTVCRRTR